MRQAVREAKVQRTTIPSNTRPIRATHAYAATADEAGAEAIIFVACVPSRKSFLKRRAMWRTWRRRPVPVVRLLLLLALQLKVRLRGCGYAHDEQFFFWM